MISFCVRPVYLLRRKQNASVTTKMKVNERTHMGEKREKINKYKRKIERYRKEEPRLRTPGLGRGSFFADVHLKKP